MVFKTILGYLDRLSTKSILTGYTGSICGFLATILLIIISCIIFIPPANDYFSGDYFQSQFTISDTNTKNQQYNTGQQIKMALVFKNRQTNVIVNHSQILQKTTSFYYMNYAQQLYTHSLEKCQPDYFAGQLNGITFQDCILIPSDLLFNTFSISGMFISLTCQSPFGCNGQPQYQYFINLFKNNYYQIYFHSKNFLKDGTSTYEVFKVYSTEFSSEEGLSSSLRIYFDKEKTQMDVSVMPWRNNIKFENLAWNGLVAGISVNQSQTVLNGAAVSYGSSGLVIFVNRYYKKLDWLIGIVGGGIFILFIIFYIPFSQINKILQKIYNSRKFMVQSQVHPYQNINNLERLSYNPGFYILGCLPNIPPFSWIPCCTNNRRSILASESKLSIVNILKKLNCAEKNLQINNSYDNFRTRKLCPSQENPRQADENIEVSDSIAPHLQNLEISRYAYQTINQSNISQKIYENNPTALAVLGKDSLEQVSIDEKYDKQDGHLKKASQPWYSHIKKWTAKILRGFDIFGAEPNFSATPQNYSCFGLLCTLIIVTLAVLTFCMTLYNMGKTYSIVQYDKVKAEDISIKLKTGIEFGLMLCFSSSTIPFLEGNTKAIDFKFVQYRNNQGPQYFTPIRLTSSSVYIFGSAQNLTNCYKIPDGQKLQIIGGPKSQDQSYFGVSIRPYCFGTASSCTNSNAAFLQAMNYINPTLYGSNLHYNPQTKKSQKISFRLDLNDNDGQITQEDHTIQEVQFFSKVEVIDDTSSFNNPKVTLEGLFALYDNYPLISINNSPEDLQYRFWIRSTGQVVKIIQRAYKVHFLLGVIGGCFLFFYFIFHWLAKIYNSYNPRAKLAQYLYSEQGYNQCCCYMWCGLSCLPNVCFPQTFDMKKNIQRIRLSQLQMKKQLNEIQLAKKIDNCWRLCSSLYPNIQSKDLSLIYFRQVIQSNEQVHSSGLIDNLFYEERDAEEDMENPVSQFESLNEHSHNETMNRPAAISSQLISQENHSSLPRDEKEFLRQQRQKEYYDNNPDPADFKNKFVRYAYKIIQQLDLFKVRGQFTFEGHRQVKSIFGGVCCLILTIGILVIIWNFFIAYSSGAYYNISQQTKVISSDNSQKLNFQVGSNFKFMFTFGMMRDYQFKNVTAYQPYLSIRAHQVQIKRKNNKLEKTISEPYDFQKCSSQYFDGFYGEYLNHFKYYKNITNGYCLPGNLNFQVAGGPATDQYKYFYVTIHPKDSSQVTFQKFKQFISNYSIFYHYLTPIIDMHTKNIQYQVIQRTSDKNPSPASVDMNISLSKVIIDNQRKHNKPLNTYTFQALYSQNYKSFYMTPQIAWKNITINYNNLVTTYTVQYMQPSQFLGIIGGICAIFVFFVWGCASSFNQYRMKYLIGKKLYRFEATKSRFSKRKKTQTEQDETKFNNYSELDILHAWIISIRGVIQDYNFNEKLRHITLIQQRVQQELNIFNFYRRLYAVESSLNKKISLNPDVKLSKLYFKDICIPVNNIEPYATNHFRIVAENNFLTSYEQNKLDKAYNSKRVIPVKVLGTNYLDPFFNKNQNQSDSQSNIHQNSSHANLSQEDMPNLRSSVSSEHKMYKNNRPNPYNKKNKQFQSREEGIIENQDEDIQEKVEAIHQRERAERQNNLHKKTYQRRKLAPIKKQQETPQQDHYQVEQKHHKQEENHGKIQQKQSELDQNQFDL